MHDSFNNGQFKIKLESTSHPFNKPREKAGKKTNDRRKETKRSSYASEIKVLVHSVLCPHLNITKETQTS